MSLAKHRLGLHVGPDMAQNIYLAACDQWMEFNVAVLCPDADPIQEAAQTGFSN